MFNKMQSESGREFMKRGRKTDWRHLLYEIIILIYVFLHVLFILLDINVEKQNIHVQRAKKGTDSLQTFLTNISAVGRPQRLDTVWQFSAIRAGRRSITTIWLLS